MDNQIIKLIIIGDSSVGKSNISLQYSEKEFQDNHEITLGVEFSSKAIYNNGKVYKLQIWDTAGQETFRSLIKTFYRGAHGCLVVYDITNRASFNNIGSWIKDLHDNCMSNIPIFIIGNKTDLSNNREVSHEEGKKYADDNKYTFFEISAKDYNDVCKVFNSLILNILANNIILSNNSIDLSKNYSNNYSLYSYC